MARWRDASGKSVGRSTGLGKGREKEAQKAADAAEELAKKPKTKDRIQRMLSDIVQDIDAIGEEAQFSKTIRQAVKEFLMERKVEMKISTLMGLTRRCKTLVEFFEEKKMADGPLGNVTTAHLLAFREQESQRVTAATANQTISFMRGFFKWARERGILHGNPCKTVGYIKVDQAKAFRTQKRREFTRDEINALFAICPPEWQSMLIAGIWTGQRLGDLARLTWGDVDFKKLQVRFDPQKTKSRKKEKNILMIPLMPELREHLLKLHRAQRPAPKPGDFVLPAIEARLHSNASGSANGLSADFADLLVKAGLRAPVSYYAMQKEGKKLGVGDTRSTHDLSFHCLRHTTASMLRQAGVPLPAIGDILGHESEEMTRLYAHEKGEASRAVMLNIAPFGFGASTPPNVVPMDASHMDADAVQELIERKASVA
jgi:integrase